MAGKRCFKFQQRTGSLEEQSITGLDTTCKQLQTATHLWAWSLDLLLSSLLKHAHHWNSPGNRGGSSVAAVHARTPVHCCVQTSSPQKPVCAHLPPPTWYALTICRISHRLSQFVSDGVIGESPELHEGTLRCTVPSRHIFQARRPRRKCPSTAALGGDCSILRWIFENDQREAQFRRTPVRRGRKDRRVPKHVPQHRLFLQ